MRDAATVLEIIRERGRKGLPLERVYRCLFNPDLFLLAYGKLYRNTGAMTPGTTRETVDGMSLDKIETIITVLRQERYRWQSFSLDDQRMKWLPVGRGLPVVVGQDIRWASGRCG